MVNMFHTNLLVVGNDGARYCLVWIEANYISNADETETYSLATHNDFRWVYRSIDWRENY